MPPSSAAVARSCTGLGKRMRCAHWGRGHTTALAAHPARGLRAGRGSLGVAVPATGLGPLLVHGHFTGSLSGAEKTFGMTGIP